MVKSTSLLVAAATVLSSCVLAAPANISYNNRLPFGKRSSSSYQCSSDDNPSLMLTHFSAVFFGDFDTDGGQDILGPLAVQGDFKASGYYVNANGDVDCSDPNDLSSYALVVGTSVHANQVRVKGAADVPAGTQGLQETQNSCAIKSNVGIYDFDQAQSNAIEASKTLASMKPTLMLDSNGRLTSAGASNGDFHIVTFKSCNNGDCNPFPGQMSDPSAMLEGIGNWNGPQGMSWPSDGTLVFNIPVDSGSTFTLKGNNPTNGLDPCRTIFNFYPADSSGAYSSGDITLKRNTGSNFGGFSLAPEAHIVDGSTGAFAGSIVGQDYSWSGSGVEIHNYNAAGGHCSAFSGCFPIHNDKPSPTITDGASSTTAIETSTSLGSSSTSKSSRPTTTTGDSTTATTDSSSTEATTTTDSSSTEATTTTSSRHHHDTTTTTDSSSTEATTTTSSKHHHDTTTTDSSITEATTTTDSSSTEATTTTDSSSTEATTTTSSKHHHDTTTTDSSSTEATTTTDSSSTEATTTTDSSSAEATTTTDSSSTEATTTTSSKHHHDTTTTTDSSITEATTTTSSKHHHDTTTTGSSITEATTTTDSSSTEATTTTDSSSTEATTTTDSSSMEATTTTDSSSTEATTTTSSKHHHKTTTTSDTSSTQATASTDVYSTTRTTEHGVQTCPPSCATATVTVVKYVTVRA